jgi:3-isopropylmalate/(R)-2-methylmalate dehydratase large subunit
VILDLIRSLGSDGAVNASLEIGGDGLASLNVDERMAVANMAVEAGADTCVLEYDRAVGDYVTSRGAIGWTPILPDADAAYLRRIAIELDRLEPTVAAPPSPANGQRVSDLRGTPVDQVYIGNCANGTLTDLRQTAAMLKGRRVKANVRVFVVPATQAIYRAAMQEGLLSIISEAGATISAPTCGACFGGHNGILSRGETAIATTNRNFRGRMGDPTAKVFLANAWVAAAAALAGEIVHPAEFGHADLNPACA